MISIPHKERDAQQLASLHIDPATQEDDFFDYSKVVVRKPWGYEFLAFQNQHVAVWILFIKGGHRTSMHCHPNKRTSLVVLSGEVEFSSMDVTRRVGECEGFEIDKATFHQTAAVSDDGVIVMEIETPVNKRDLVRLQDAYGRVNQGYEGQEHMSYNLNNYNHLTFTGPEVYYEKKKKFGNTSVTLTSFADDAEFQRREKTDLIAVLGGQILRGDAIAAKPGETLELDAESEHALPLHIDGRVEALLIKKNDTLVRLADYVCSFLESKGVRKAFVASGQRNTHLLDALAKDNAMSYLFFHHEQAAAMAAQSYAKITQTPGLCITSSGASAANAITGIIGSWIDSVPCIIISGQSKLSETVGSSGLRQFGIDEVNIIDMVKPVTKYAALVTDPATIRQHLEQAYTLATTGRPGPVWLDLPLDVQVSTVDERRLVPYAQKEYESNASNTNSTRSADRHPEYNRVLTLLGQAKRPVLLAGNGIRIARAQRELLEVIGKLGIPVVTSRNAKDLIPYEHPLCIGTMGAYGNRAANFAVQNADLLISIGCRLSLSEIGCEYKLFAREAKKIIIDIDPAELAKPSAGADIPLAVDAGDFLRFLNATSVTSTGNLILNVKHWLAQCVEWKAQYPPIIIKPSHENRTNHVDVYHFIDLLSRFADKKAIVVLDRGVSFYATSQAFRISGQQRIISSSGIHSSGFSIPGAIGAHIAAPGSDVLCIAGDGGIQLNAQELPTIVHHKMPIKIFILDNHGHATIRKTQKAYFKGKHIGTDTQSGKAFPSIPEVMRGYGIETLTINNDTELDEKLPELLSRKGPFACIINIDEEQQPEPRLVSSVSPDGKLTARPLEDLYPFLSREELQKNLFIRPVDDDSGDDSFSFNRDHTD